MKTKKVIINIGIPGSGKSTWTKEFIQKNSDWVSIGRDDFRIMLRNQTVVDFKVETLINKLVMKSARQAISAGFNVILDNTHCKLSYINDAIKALNDIAEIEYRYFDVPLNTCIIRDSSRKNSVGEVVIKKMHKDLKILLDIFDFQPLKKQERLRYDYSKDWNPKLPNAIISDIDGTVAHMNGRRGPFDWHKVGVDDPDQPVIEAIKAWKQSGAKIIMVSGRDAVCRKETIEWLIAAGIEMDELFMRPKDDFRKDTIIKKEIYENNIKDKYNIIMVYDDRDQVVDMWRSLRIKCAQVEPGEF